MTCSGSPEVGSTAFGAQPPELPTGLLVNMDFAISSSLVQLRRPLCFDPVLVHRLALLIHASFRPRLATTPLRFSSPLPPPGWTGDFHPQAVEHVRHTKERHLHDSRRLFVWIRFALTLIGYCTGFSSAFFDSAA